MAKGTRRLVIDPNAQIPISINDPLSSLRDDYMQGRIRMTPGAANFPTLDEQLSGRISGGSDISVRPSVSRVPNIAPMPLGCPAGFYQQGDVCIPSVDLIPGEDKFPRVAGKVFPKGVIIDIIPPQYTNRGEFFYIQCVIENDGSTKGRFFFRVTIPHWNVDTETEAIPVDGFAQALLYKRVRVPNHAASLEEVEVEITISHLNEEEEHMTDETKIIDDTAIDVIPGPYSGGSGDGGNFDDADDGGFGSGGGSGSGGSPPPQCFTMTLARLYDLGNTRSGITFNNIDAVIQELNTRRLSINNTAIEWCPTGANSALAVIVSGIPYVPTSLRDENDLKSVAISLTPHSAVRDGDPVTVSGMNFAPNETVDIEFSQLMTAIDPDDDATIAEVEGKTLTSAKTINADTGGDFRTTIRAKSMPSGVKADGKITAMGVRSGKITSKLIQVV
jgi:hypothetical protein